MWQQEFMFAIEAPDLSMLYLSVYDAVRHAHTYGSTARALILTLLACRCWEGMTLSASTPCLCAALPAAIAPARCGHETVQCFGTAPSLCMPRWWRGTQQHRSRGCQTEHELPVLTLAASRYSRANYVAADRGAAASAQSLQ